MPDHVLELSHPKTGQGAAKPRLLEDDSLVVEGYLQSHHRWSHKDKLKRVKLYLRLPEPRNGLIQQVPSAVSYAFRLAICSSRKHFAQDARAAKLLKSIRLGPSRCH